MILPESHRPAVARALRTAFGVEAPDSVMPLAGGLSGAQVLRIRVGGVPYVLRIEGAGDMVRDPFRWYGCLRTAAQAALAPRVWYADPADGVAILDFVEAGPSLSQMPGGRSALLTELGQMARFLHQTPAFPPLLDYFDALLGLAGQLEAVGAPEALAPTLKALGRAVRLYRTLPAEPVSSHNDLNPRNILFDGRRLWLVDFESAFLADRYVDLAALVNFFAHDEADLVQLTTAYFGRPATAAEMARLWLMRQINHVFYGVMFLQAAGQTAVGFAEAAPSLDALHARLGAGEDLFASAAGRARYGLARLDAARSAIDGPGFEAAARVLAA